MVETTSGWFTKHVKQEPIATSPIAESLMTAICFMLLTNVKLSIIFFLGTKQGSIHHHCTSSFCLYTSWIYLHFQCQLNHQLRLINLFFCSNRIFNLSWHLSLWSWVASLRVLLHSYGKFLRPKLIIDQKPKQDFLSWFCIGFTSTSLYFCKITIYNSTISVRSGLEASILLFNVNAATGSMLGSRISSKCHWTVSIQFLGTINVRVLWKRIIYRLIYRIILVIIIYALLEYGIS
jgi:hypothetical protein